MSKRGDTRASELKNLIFKVFGVLSTKQRKIEVESIGFLNSGSFTIGDRRLITCWKSTSKVEIKSIKGGSQNRSGSGGEKCSVARFGSGGELLGEEIFSVVKLKVDLLLLICSTKLILVDFRSKSITSSLCYCIRKPIFDKKILIDGDIILHSKFGSDSLKISKIAQGGETIFRALGVLDLSSIADFLYTWQTLGFREISENEFEVLLSAEMVDLSQIILSKSRLLRVKFGITDEKEPEDEDGLPFMVGVSSFKVETSIEDMSGAVSAYHKGSQWYAICVKGREFFYSRLPRNTKTAKNVTSGGGLYGKIDMNGQIKKAHIYQDLVYLVEGQSLKMVKLKNPDRRGYVSEYELIKSLNLGRDFKIYFDEKTGTFGIFLLTRERIGAKESRMRIEILDQELEVVDKMTLDGLDKIYYFEILRANELYIFSCSRSSADFGESSRSIIVNIVTRSVIDLVEEDGQEFMGTPIVSKNGRYVATKTGFSNHFNSFWGGGIFVSDSF